MLTRVALRFVTKTRHEITWLTIIVIRLRSWVLSLHLRPCRLARNWFLISQVIRTRTKRILSQSRKEWNTSVHYLWYLRHKSAHQTTQCSDHIQSQPLNHIGKTVQPTIDQLNIPKTQTASGCPLYTSGEACRGQRCFGPVISTVPAMIDDSFP